MPEKSAIEFLIFACVTISCPFRMPPSNRPTMTSTMAISTSVKPRPLARMVFPKKKAGMQPAFWIVLVSLERAAEGIDVGAGFRVGRTGGRRGDRRVRRGLQLPAHRAGRDGAVVHLRVHRDRHLVRNVR